MDQRKATELSNVTAACAILILIACIWAQEATASKPFDFEEASRSVPKPREIWPLVRKHIVPLDFEVQVTIEMIPNYCHSNFSEIQYMDFMMWVAHVFDGRPLSRISEMDHQRQEDRTIFRARVESAAKVQVVRTWYVYSDDPTWRDLMWYHLLMHKVGDHYEAVLPGKMPDAFMIEVGDIAMGFPGYVSSVPVKLTDAPVIERQSRGSLPRLWRPSE